MKALMFSHPHKATQFFWILCLAIFGIYFTTVARHPAAFGDSEELITTAYLLGVAHPPGYPFSQLILHLTTHLPIPGSIAFRANLLAALYHAFAIGFIYLAAHEILKRVSLPPPCNRLNRSFFASIGAMLFALTPLFWTYANVYEVFALNDLYAALLVYLWLKILYSKRPNRQFILLFFAISGLALAHQQLILLIILPLSVGLIFHLFSKPSSGCSEVKYVLLGGGLGPVLFIGSYSLLPWYHSQAAALSWQFTPSWSGWLTFVLRQDFASPNRVTLHFLNAYLSPLSPVDNWLALKNYLLTTLNTQLGVPMLLAIIGIGSVIKTLPRWGRYGFGVALGLSTIGLGSYLTVPDKTGLSNDYWMLMGITERMYLMGYVVVSIGLAPGLLWIYVKMFRDRHHWLFWAVFMLLPLWLGWRNFPQVDLRSYRLPMQYSQTVLTSLPNQAILGCFSDQSCFSLLYTQLVEGLRPDLTIVPITRQLRYHYLHQKFPEIVPFWYDHNELYMSSVLAWNGYQGRPVFVTQMPSEFLNQWDTEGKVLFALPQNLRTQLTCVAQNNQTAKQISFSSRPTQSFMKAFAAMLAEQQAQKPKVYSRKSCLTTKEWKALYAACNEQDARCQYQALYNGLWANPADIDLRRLMLKWYEDQGVNGAAYDETQIIKILEAGIQEK